jgi:purine-cytosine permease-like protein
MRCLRTIVIAEHESNEQTLRKAVMTISSDIEERLRTDIGNPRASSRGHVRDLAERFSGRMAHDDHRRIGFLPLFTHSGRHGIGTVIAAAAGTFVAGLLGAYGAAATLGKFANVFEVLVNFDSRWLTLALVLIVIALDNWTINVLNLYTGGLSLSNIVDRLGRFWTTLIVSILGIALSAAPGMVNGYTDYVGALGNAFGPIAGVLLVDYLVFKRSRIDVPALFDPGGLYWYWGGFNVLAIIWTILGFLLCTLFVPVAEMPVLVALIVTAIGYSAAVVLVRSRSPVLEQAMQPGKQHETIEELDLALANRR